MILLNLNGRPAPATQKPHLCWFCNQGIGGNEDVFSAVWVEYPDFDIPQLGSEVVLRRTHETKKVSLPRAGICSEVFAWCEAVCPCC